MKRLFTAIAMALCLFVSQSFAATAPFSFETFGEKLQLNSASPVTFAQIRNGGIKDDLQVDVYLSLPENASGKVPAVVLLPGSGGISPSMLPYKQSLNSMGIATLTVDFYTPRGHQSVGVDYTNVTLPAMTLDTLKSLDFLHHRKDIDSKRIGVIGWSYGGVPAMASAFRDLSDQVVGRQGPRYKVHVPIYPPCIINFPNERIDGGAWMHIHGAEDDLTPAKSCQGVLSDVSQKVKVKSVLLPQAYHSFDADYQLRYDEQAVNANICRVDLTPEWDMVETNSGILIDTVDTLRLALGQCTGLGAHHGQNRRAAESSMRELLAFLKQDLVGEALVAYEAH